MKALKFGLLAIAAILSISSIKAQTADQIISKHLDALGGKAKIAEIKTIRMESTLDIAGNTAPTTISIINGKGYRNEIDFNGQKIIQVATDKSGWAVNPMSGSSAPTPMAPGEYKTAKEQIYIAGPLFNYAEKGSKVELVGKEDVKGMSTFKLKLTTADNAEMVFNIDTEKYYMVKSVSPTEQNGEKMELTSYFSDYRKTDFGYMVPYKIELVLPQISFVSTTTKVEINQAIPESIFNQN